MHINIAASSIMTAKNTLSIDDAIEERSTGSFVVIDEEGANHYKKGQQIAIYNDSEELIFAGVIDVAKEKKIPFKGLYHSITCIDWHYLTDKRVVSKAYENQTADAIVKDLIDTVLYQEGITAGNIQAGPMVSEAVFNYVNATNVLDALSEKAGFIWYVDYDKKLYFIERATFYAPWTATSANMLKESIAVEHSNPNYRNKQYIKGGKDITDPVTEKFAGDGKARTWVVGFPVAKEPSIKVNTTTLLESEIGIRGLETGKKYYWSKGYSEITQDESQALLTSSDTLEITYQGEFDIVAISFNSEQIEERQLIEGNSGIVENVADEVENNSRDSAFQSANAKLKKYGVIGRRLRYTTTKHGLKSGQIQIVNLPEHDINNVEMLIECVTITYENNMFYYTVTCAEGPEQNSWAKMFKAMATRGQAFVVRQNISEKQILVTLSTLSKTWLSSDAKNIFKELYPSATLYPSAALYPMFEFADRVKYIELLTSSNVVLSRKRITKQTGTATNNILSTIYIAPWEANGTIAKVRFYGGSDATEVNGSGVMIDEQPYAKLKTQLEALNIEKTDTKGW